MPTSTATPSPADALILKDNPEMTADVLDQAREKMRENGIVAGGDAANQGIGAMTDARWSNFYQIISKQDPSDYPPGLPASRPRGDRRGAGAFPPPRAARRAA